MMLRASFDPSPAALKGESARRLDEDKDASDRSEHVVGLWTGPWKRAFFVGRRTEPGLGWAASTAGKKERNKRVGEGAEN